MNAIEPLSSSDAELFDADAFDGALLQSQPFLALFKNTLKQGQTVLHERFKSGTPVRDLILGRAWLLDQLLQRAWAQYQWPDDGSVSLVAVGGYGRGELHPHSDIDVLILLSKGEPEAFRDSIEGFLTFLWDSSLEVGSSVRTVEQCFEEAKKDITIATNLIESRTLVGDDSIRQAMYEKVTDDSAWSSQEFYKAKVEEQRLRHKRTNDTSYNLEPNIKDSAGGLRDLQTVGWVAKRHFGATYLRDLVDHDFVNQEELDALIRGEEYLWQLRYALHMITDKAENRLLFDHQRTLAAYFGYEDQPGSLAVEQFMNRYYRNAMFLAEFNDMLLQHFEEEILEVDQDQSVTPINKRFQIRNKHIEAIHDHVFERTPFALLEIFVLLAQNQELEGVRSSTMRLIRSHRHLIDDKFRADIRNTSMFMELLHCKDGVTTELKRMTRYGVLGRYLPEFGKIVGQMQHDLFHIYTVDAHTIKLITNLRRFRHEDQKEKFPIAHHIVNNIPKIHLLYIAGLYHDIAKGRGGDHSELGAVDAIDFCKRHHLGKWDTHIVSWLVEKHLLMSMTAQRMDISDPDVIHDFAKQMGDVTHLDYLFALTVADINATNHTLWNDFRAALMRQLYTETKRVLRRGLQTPPNIEDQIEQTQKEALEILQKQGFSRQRVEHLWRGLTNDYYLREQAEDIAWHTVGILNHPDRNKPLVMIKEISQRRYEGGTQIFVYTQDHEGLFAATASALDHLNLSIHDARIITNNDGYSYNTFIVLNAEHRSVGDNVEQIQHIKDTLTAELSNPADYRSFVQRRVPRQMKLFAVATQVILSTDAERRVTAMEIITADRPGLLARVGAVLLECHVHLNNAKIINVGEHVEDVFFITDNKGQPITDPQLLERLQTRIKEELDSQLKNDPAVINF